MKAFAYWAVIVWLYLYSISKMFAMEKISGWFEGGLFTITFIGIIMFCHWITGPMNEYHD